MNPYDSEVARSIYKQLQVNPNKDYPITALLVDGILKNFVYGTHSKYPNGDGETIHMNIPGKVLNLPSWSEGIQSGVEGIMNSTNEKQRAA